MIKIPFDNSYARLPDTMFTRINPEPVNAPSLIAWNADLAADLGIETGDQDLAKLFSGNEIPDGADPIAQLYAGHQFGTWNPQLGDGRAVLLGEVLGPNGRFDIQLKGSGRTPYSRNGDGRAWIGPVLREYLMSEAMHALGIPTTRALAAVATGDRVQREQGFPGAVLTRVAASHIRVGTFQVYAARGMTSELQALCDYTIARHYPDASGPADLLAQALDAQAKLIAKWMSVGFIHGVMNTDNCQIAGETIDYGPCAFMDDYQVAKVFSSIDQTGRYAYGNQPRIAVWNMAQFATALVPLMEDQDAAIEEFTNIINTFPDLYDVHWRAAFGPKIGIADPDAEAARLIEDLLALMERGQADFTNTFANLHRDNARDQFLNPEDFDAWAVRWRAMNPDLDLMARTNPQVIPRLHRIESVIQSALSGDLTPFHDMLAVVTIPYAPADPYFTNPPTASERVARTFCGT